MNSHWLAIAALAALAAAGCRSRPEQRAVMDSYQEELRRYEGIIYDLEYQNTVLCTENERLKKRLEGAGASKSRRVDEGPRLFDTPKPRSTTEPDDTPSLDIEMGDPTPSPTPSRPGSNKPVTPEAEPDDKPAPEIRPPANRKPPPPDKDSAPEDVEPLPPKDKPADDGLGDAHPTDIDAPPMVQPEASPRPDDEDLPPKPPSILKTPDKPPASETLPIPRPSVNPSPKPKSPELLPAPTARRTSFQDAVGSRSLEPQRANFVLPNDSPPQQQQWTPRSVRRSTSDDLR
jgi:hypothetical protein